MKQLEIDFSCKKCHGIGWLQCESEVGGFSTTEWVKCECSPLPENWDEIQDFPAARLE